MEGNHHLQVDFLASNTVKGSIQGDKVDFTTHSYPLIQDPVVIEGVRMGSLDDIAAFKLNAIIGNGTRLKDFVDIAFLAAYLPFTKMLAAFESKYKTRNPVMTVKALTYHKDINFKEPLNLIEGSSSGISLPAGFMR